MRSRAASLALLAVVGLAGCGSVSASVKDLRQDAGRICRRTNHAFRSLSTPNSQAQDASFLASGLARLELQLRRLRALTPPHDVADVYAAGLAGLGREADALRQTVAAIKRGQDPGLAYRTLGQQLTPLERQVDSAWQALQIADCLQ